jgi:hypothetical protein
MFYLRIIVTKLDGTANLIRTDGYHVIDQLAADSECFSPHSLDGRTIGK